jgi:hypothetical protein
MKITFEHGDLSHVIDLELPDEQLLHHYGRGKIRQFIQDFGVPPERAARSLSDEQALEVLAHIVARFAYGELTSRALDILRHEHLASFEQERGRAIEDARHEQIRRAGEHTREIVERLIEDEDDEDNGSREPGNGDNRRGER